MVRLTYEVGVADYEGYSVRLVRGPTMRAYWWKHRASNLIAWPLLSAALLFVLSLSDEQPMSVKHIGGIAGIVFMIGVATLPIDAVVYPWWVRRMARKMVGDDPEEFFLGPQKLDAGSDGLTLVGGGVKTHYSWPAIKRLDETASHIFLMTGRVHGIIVPKRGLDAEALNSLRDTVRASIVTEPNLGVRKSAG